MPYNSGTDVVDWQNPISDTNWVRVDLSADIAQKVPFANIASNSDMNNMKDNGHYWFTLTDPLLSNPALQAGYTNGTSDFYHLIVLGQISNQYITQIATEVKTQRMFIRTSTFGGAGWNTWREFRTNVASSSNTLSVSESRPNNLVGSLFDVNINTVVLANNTDFRSFPTGFYYLGESNGSNVDTNWVMINRVGGQVWHLRLRVYNGGSSYSVEMRWSGNGVNFTQWVRLPNDFEVNDLISSYVDTDITNLQDGLSNLQNAVRTSGRNTSFAMYGQGQGTGGTFDLKGFGTCLWLASGYHCHIHLWTPGFTNTDAGLRALDGVNLNGVYRYLEMKATLGSLNAPPAPHPWNRRKWFALGRVFINAKSDDFENDNLDTEVLVAVDRDPDNGKARFYIVRSPDGIQGNTSSHTFSGRVGGHLHFTYMLETPL